MDFSIYIIPFAYSLHGYATARQLDYLKTLSYPLMILPLFLDMITGNISGYRGAFNIPAWQFIVATLISVGIIGVSWITGYGIGKLQGD